jgi:pyruvate/2-oxoglutarate dehydrogenase complex dihydrolipoamide acyltransferase (E2) component
VAVSGDGEDGLGFLARSLSGVLLAGLAVGLLAFAGGLFVQALQERAEREGGGREAAERVAAVRVVTVRAETATPVIEAFGELRARRELEVRAPVAGRIIEIAPAFEEGGRVARGELLLAVDPAPARAALDRARAEASEAEAELRDARRSLDLAGDELAAARAQGALQERALERARSLAGRGVGSEAAIETAELALSSAEQAILSRRGAEVTAEARVDQARARIERASIDLAEAERDLADTEIRATFDGVLADVATLQGGLVGANERLARLVDPDRLEAAFRVSAVQRARLTDDGGVLVGAPVAVSLGVSGAEIGTEGRISREAVDVGEGGTGRMLYAALDPAPALRAGDFVRVLVEEPPLPGVARLPASAVASDGTALALGEEERLEVVPVSVLRRQGDDVLVDAAALEGRRLVAERSPLVGPGIRVRPIGPPSEPTPSEATPAKATSAEPTPAVASPAEAPEAEDDAALAVPARGRVA